MKVGDAYTSPWGRYVVASLSPLVLFGGMGAAIVTTDLAPEFKLEEVPVGVANAEHAAAVSVVATRGERVSAALAGAVGPVVAARDEHAVIEPRPAERTFGGMRPGTVQFVNPAVPDLHWRPCLTRAEGGREHAWFLCPTNHRTLYCHACWPSKPRVIFIQKGRTYTYEEKLALAGFRLPAGAVCTGPDAGRPAPAGAVSAEHADRVGVPAGAVSTGPHRPVSVPVAAASGEPIQAGPALQQPLQRREDADYAMKLPYRPSTRDAWVEECRERAAILEYDAGLSRAEAEALARELVGPNHQPMPARAAPDPTDNQRRLPL